MHTHLERLLEVSLQCVAERYRGDEQGTEERDHSKPTQQEVLPAREASRVQGVLTNTPREPVGADSSQAHQHENVGYDVDLRVVHHLHQRPEGRRALVHSQAEGEGAGQHSEPGEQPQALGQPHAPLQGEFHLQKGHGALQAHTQLLGEQSAATGRRQWGAVKEAKTGDHPSTKLQVSAGLLFWRSRQSSSAFNTIVPTRLVDKLIELGLNTPLCAWILDFLTARPQVVRVGRHTSNPSP
ncbi:hypothetical protein N1851_024482 [Merluccius polli]|uniref:Uncharacterized protein n=1 Tax=Merluccius polli TaxID=89951 RepID=A0AA47NWU9_MERPO|nr:hypothetical protein N1851_024482 [Merluccius polli]